MLSASAFAFAMLIYEALKDSLINNAEIDKMKDVPMWFTSAQSDTLAPINQ